MSTFLTTDGTEIFYKDWGPRDAQPIVFHHGWPLSSDDWDKQMLFFASKGYRVIAHDRRGHGRSVQTDLGHDMDTYAADVAELVNTLDLTNAVHIGHSTGGGEAARYVARAESRCIRPMRRGHGATPVNQRSRPRIASQKSALIWRSGSRFSRDHFTGTQKVLMAKQRMSRMRFWR
ncbi:alpha/beta hydrolase family protein [Yoonia maricola]|uniref:Alpha/beta hydrolase family protein n=1 Tax=Yoonia maricola TaxID=420999 RepID=A0A2M8W562_9RHOB|nr:alpha/beta hydrolase [Yoonia maricola]PJI86049.1 alpha/beta hydrolase family protein [Yoonia maricola]